MKKILFTFSLAASLTLISPTAAFAHQWIQDSAGWRSQKDDASFHADGWQWIDGKCYYFTPEGYCLINTTTPDGHKVDANGAWTVNGAVQVQTNEADRFPDSQSGDYSGEDSGLSGSHEEYSDGESSYARDIARIVNEEREKKDLNTLEWDEDLAACAQNRAYEIQESFSHTRPDGSDCFTILEEEGIAYTSCGENIASGQPSPEIVMNNWMDSPGHKKNILNSSFNRIGTGCANIGGNYYWVQLFTD